MASPTRGGLAAPAPGHPRRTRRPKVSVVARLLSPVGRWGSGFAVALGIGLALYMSLTADETTAYVAMDSFRHPVLCGRGDVAYEQTGTPYTVRLPHPQGAVLTGDGQPCRDVGPWIASTRLDYWHLLLNGAYWTFLVYAALLAPALIVSWCIGRLRT
jgi:hypothetical protein